MDFCAGAVALVPKLACIVEARHFHSLFRTLRDSDSVTTFHGGGVRARISSSQMVLGKCRQMLFYEMEAVVRSPQAKIVTSQAADQRVPSWMHLLGCRQGMSF
jgi:hypothetical protein